MEKIHVDRRVRKTKRQLQSGLIQLMQEKSIQKITVSELSNLVDINRGTFYLHYKDAFDMLDQIENKLAEDFLEILQHYPSLIVKSNVLPLLTEVFSFIEENEGMMRVMLCKNGDAILLNRLKDSVKKRFFDDWQKKYLTQASKQIEYFFSYFISGCISLITHWLETGMNESPEQIAKLNEIMILKGNDFFVMIDHPLS